MQKPKASNEFSRKGAKSNPFLRLCAFAGALLLVSAFSTYAQLTPSERRGKEIYLRGSGEITAYLGEIEVPGATLTCAGCHGTKGEGKTEGGINAGSLTWSNLQKPYGHTHTTGRHHGPFTETAFIRAVVNGLDSNNNHLLPAMPRYKLPAAAMADLIAYLKRIETDVDPGLAEDSIAVGLILPSSGAFAEMGAAMKEVLTAYFDNFNNRGGSFNRRIELRFTDSATAAKDQIFAFVGGLSAGSDVELAALARSEQIPFIGPSTLLPHTENPVNRYLFYLLPGVAEQAAALVNFAHVQPKLKQASIAIVHNETKLNSAAATAAAEQVSKLGRSVVKNVGYKSNAFDARALATELKTMGAGAVFFFGDGREQSLLIREAGAAGWSPQFYVLGVFSGKDFAVTENVFVAYPTIPSDVNGEGLAEFRSLYEKYRFSSRSAAVQLSAFAAARVFVEGLTRAGRDLSREKFITALESLYEYDTGVSPRITFGPNRRVGAAGAYVVTIDPSSKDPTPIATWVSAY